MAAKHDDFIFLIRTVDLTDQVVARLSFGDEMTTQIELETDSRTVGKKSRDTAEILIAHDDRGYHLFNVEGPIIERTHRAAIQLRLVDANQSSVIEKKFVDLFVDLRTGQCSRPRR